MAMQRSDEEMRRIMGQQFAELNRNNREIKALDEFRVTHKIITDPLVIHGLANEENSKP